MRLFELQTNGGFCHKLQMPVNFSDADGLTTDRCEALTLQLLEQGTAAYLATAITAPDAVLCKCASVIERFMRSQIGRHCLGFHAECFFLGVDGYRGAHPAEHCLLDGEQGLKRYRSLRDILGPALKVITLGPNVPGIDELISQAVKDGVLVCLGHYGAYPESDPAAIQLVCESVRRAVALGARMSTHLGNGTRIMGHRQGGHITTQLVDQRLSAGLITDGIHLSDDFLKLCLMAKGPKRSVIVSDASPLAGAPVGNYTFGGPVEVVPWRDTFKVAPAGQPELLAGSWATLLPCVNYAWKMVSECGPENSLGITPQDILEMASTNPLSLIGMPPTALDEIGGPQVEFLDGTFQIVET